MSTYQLAAEDPDRWAPIPEVAARMGVSTRTIYRLIAAGGFPLPVHEVAGRKMVSLKLLVAHLHGEAA